MPLFLRFNLPLCVIRPFAFLCLCLCWPFAFLCVYARETAVLGLLLLIANLLRFLVSAANHASLLRFLVSATNRESAVVKVLVRSAEGAF